MSNVPIILKEGTKVTESRNEAISENISAVRTISEAIKSTLGPKGFNKMLVDSIGDVTVTNDCFTILDEIEVEHPAAKMVIQVAKTLNKNVGDGVTKAVILAGELLRIGEELLDQKVHPNIIISAFNKALTKSLEILNKESKKIDISDVSKLRKIALTTLNSKSTFGSAEILADISTKAVSKIIEKRGDSNYVDLDLIQIIKKEGDQLNDSSLIEGVIIDKEVVNDTMPKLMHDGKIALIDHSLEITKTEFDTDIKITNPDQILGFKSQEELMIKKMVDKIAQTGANVVFCQKGIDDLAQHFLAANGIMAIRRVKRSDLRKLMKATHGNIITDLKNINSKDLGKANLVQEKQIGKDKMIFIEDCENPQSMSILIRGGTRHIIEDAERSLKNVNYAIKDAIEDPYIVAGAGAIEMEIAKQIRKYAHIMSTRESIAVEQFANCLEIIPTVLSENSGLDPVSIITELHVQHEKLDGSQFGINLENGKTINSAENGIIEPRVILRQALNSATELCLMILRIDEIIAASKGGSGPKMPTSPDENLED